VSSEDLKRSTEYLKLGYIREHHAELAADAARKHWSHGDYLQKLLDGEVATREQRALERRIAVARFPVKKTIDQYQWDWPKKVNEQQVRHLFRMGFVESKTNVVFVGGVGLGKTHLASALGYAACQAGHSVLFTTAVDAVNNLLAAQAAQKLKQEMARYANPAVLIMDEIGYLPLDKAGADLLFQIISKRYERGSIILTTNKAYKQWPSIFNNDAGITSAILDRLLHQSETVVIEGKSYRMKNRVEDPPA
jgi:DNA replication protein DnaC